MRKKELGLTDSVCNNEILEVRIHGRGGQGAVTTAQLLAMAAFYDGKYAQAFPFFGVERRGSPSVSFVRISDRPINIREQVYCPDYEIVFDPSLIEISKAVEGVKRSVLVNSKKQIKDYNTQDVTEEAMEIFGKPIINTLILGAFAGFTQIVTMESLLKAVEQKFQGREELIIKNKRAIREAYAKATGNGN